MARPLRIDVENGLYHVTSRGWERRVMVRDDRDRQRWLQLLDRVAARCGWRVFAWVLMSNHFHLYLRTPRPNLSAGMHDLNSGYASGFNRRYRRCGALFQGRFQAVLVENDSHALELTRYVHLNPVRASIVVRPEEYAWSSYQDYLAVRAAPGWLDCEAVLAALAKNGSRARSAYRCFVEAGLAEPPTSPLEHVAGGMLLGSDDWIDQWRRRLSAEPAREAVPLQRELAWRPSLENVVATVCEAFGAAPADLRVSGCHGNEARSAAIYLARRATDLAVDAIRAHFGGVSAAAISKTVARMEIRRARDLAWDQRLAELAERLQASGNHPQG